jgi:hypothetical protein
MGVRICDKVKLSHWSETALTRVAPKQVKKPKLHSVMQTSVNTGSTLTSPKLVRVFRRHCNIIVALLAMAKRHLHVYFLIFLTMFRCVKACSYTRNSVRSLSNHQVRCEAYQKEEAHSAVIHKSVAAPNKQKLVQQKQSGSNKVQYYIRLTTTICSKLCTELLAYHFKRSSTHQAHGPSLATQPVAPGPGMLESSADIGGEGTSHQPQTSPPPPPPCLPLPSHPPSAIVETPAASSMALLAESENPSRRPQ